MNIDKIFRPLTNTHLIQYHNLYSILAAIQNETVPMPNHADPGAVSDCWKDALQLADDLRGIISSSLGDIIQERTEHIYKHHRDVVDDLNYNPGYTLLNGALYCLTEKDEYYPTIWSPEYKKKLNSKSHREKVIIAASLLAAYVDRYDYEQSITSAEITSAEKQQDAE